MMRTSRSRGPPPRRLSTGSTSAASASSSGAVLRAAPARAAGRSARSSTCICPIISGGVVLAKKPPPARASLAMKEAPATTDGSSIAIGTSTSRPLTRKLSADAERQAEDADHVLDHVVGGGWAQAGSAVEGGQIAGSEFAFA